MSRIQASFDKLKAQGRKALIPYITAGDSHPAMTVPMMHAMVEAGADIIELGVPFSDPMADGPVIQLACERALIHGVTLRDVLAMVSEFRRTNSHTPVVLMGYLNPVEIMGYETFAKNAQAAGVDGLLIVDLPPEEATDLKRELNQRDMDVIFLVAPTTSEARMRLICEQASGFIYYVSLKGVTGSAALDVTAVQSKIDLMRTITDLPLGVGFGIRDGETAAAVSKAADAVVVGSVLVSQIAEHVETPKKAQEAIVAILSEMRSAMD